MTISQVVQSVFFEEDSQQLIRIPTRASQSPKSLRRRDRDRKKRKTESKRSRLLWTTEEHDRFLEALELYPSGPWKVIADHVGTRTTRQAMTHAQKYRQKIERRKKKELEKSEEDSTTSEAQQLLLPSSTPVSDTERVATPSTEERIVFTEPVNSTPGESDCDEHAVLLAFLEDFQPSEVDNGDPLPYTNDGAFLLEVGVTPSTSSPIN
ncbi:hypothetical protein BBJ28_00003029 [Nothophytophthora sp. Chile5]|nr:hypothetical protein BBJ28_00003029 [Nothophytophthora sp. Chile5]